MAIVKLSASERRRLSAFFTCLVLAALAWLFTNLSNPYTFTVKRVITYKNTPQRRAFHSLQSDTVSVTVNGTGWQMLFSKLNDESKALTVDLRPLESNNYVALSSQIKQISINKDVHDVVSFNPDTLYFDFLNRTVKRVPIKLVSNIKYQEQFAQLNNAIIKPAYVTLDGPSNRIDKITEWQTDSLIADNVNETIRTKLDLQPPNEGNITVYPKAVDVILPVDEYTEKTLQIPVKLLNNTDYYNVKVFPEKVKVTFLTSLKRYTEIDENFFEADADLNLWKNQGYTTLPVKLIRMPPFCRIISIDPPNIDFIVKK
jgi:YbbR domain-containing protein